MSENRDDYQPGHFMLCVVGKEYKNAAIRGSKGLLQVAGRIVKRQGRIVNVSSCVIRITTWVANNCRISEHRVPTAGPQAINLNPKKTSSWQPKNQRGLSQSTRWSSTRQRTIQSASTICPNATVRHINTGSLAVMADCVVRYT